uniref:UDP-D-xylose:beta-D-glucoside alpha-1,3-D-xylosyltransferase n=1 Tax=Homalodisca liturata TaxID=320908 RepID=A0A1B6HKJ2_9HEMI
MRLLSKLIVFVWLVIGFLIIYFLESVWFNKDRTAPKLFRNIISVNLNRERSVQKYSVDLSSTQYRTIEKERSFTASSPSNDFKGNLRDKISVALAVVACGDRLHETLVMIKSAILFSNNVKLQVIVIADIPLIKGFDEKLSEWRSIVNNSFDYQIKPVAFPENGKEEWRKLFKPCAAQRLFLPGLLKELDSVLYVDTDTLFLGPLEEVWLHFSRMNSSQMAALAPEHEDPNTGWYNRFARHPYYGELGVNSGVMLMNLTRMRDFGWEKYLAPIYKEFKLKITWGDQDIINIIFHYHPERLYVYSCRYNYRSDHCMYMSVCEDANKHGVAVIHGSRSTFHGDKQPAFKTIYSCMEEYQLGSDPYSNLLLTMENGLDQTSHTNCGKVRHVLTKNLHKYISVKEPFR